MAEDRVAVSKKSVRPASHGDGLANAVEATTDARSTAPAGLVADVLSLQTVAGNQAVQRLIARAETASTRVALAVQRAGPDAGAPAAAPPEVLAVVLDHLADQPAVTYATVKARIQAAPAAQRGAVLNNEPLLRKLLGKLPWDDFAKTVELLGRRIPTYSDLIANATVTAELAAAWVASIPTLQPAGAPPGPQHEEGGWVYLNIVTGQISVGRQATGGQASINLSAPPTPADCVVVAKFHTHPNLGPAWVHGPSAGDIAVDAQHAVPDIIVAHAGPVVPGAVVNYDTLFQSGPAQRAHLSGIPGLPAAGTAPQARVDGTMDEP